MSSWWPPADYVVRPRPGVTAVLARAERRVQGDFQEILSILALNPYPNPQFPLITEDLADDGSRVFTYSDDYFPYAIHYVVFEPVDDESLISVIDLTLLPRHS